MGSGYRYNCDAEEALVASTEEYQVKCCSDERVSGEFVGRESSLTFFSEDSEYESLELGSVCPYRLNDSDQCPGKRNHEDAVKYCDDKGGRLCTSEELHNGCARNGPSSCDQDLVWTTPYSYILSSYWLFNKSNGPCSFFQGNAKL